MPSELPGTLNPQDPRSVASAIRDIADLLGIDHLRVAITATRVMAGVWLYSVQVVDRRGQPIQTTADVDIFVSEALGGPTTVNQAENFLTGTVIYTDIVHGAWGLRTDPNGHFTMTLTFASGSRFLNGKLTAQYQSSAECPA
jgi:hypothetical protein